MQVTFIKNWTGGIGSLYKVGDTADLSIDLVRRLAYEAAISLTPADLASIGAPSKELVVTAAQAAAFPALVSGGGKGVSVASSVTGGATPWSRLFGPNEFRTGWAGSAEWTNVPAYVTAQSAANGPAMYRKEGASILMDFSKATQTYGNYRNQSAALPATTFKSTPIALVVYIHRMQLNMSIRLRIGLDSSNYIDYRWQSAMGMLSEGWNVLLAHTSEPIGVGNSPNGQLSFQSTGLSTAGSTTDGWYATAGSFDPNTNGATINYVAVEFLNYGSAVGNSRSYAWVEGIYTGGKEIPRLTLGFDIQTNGLDLAKATLDKYGLTGYAAVPTANGSPVNPSYLWTAADVTRMQALYTAGWDIVQHSVSHNSMGSYSDDAMLAAEIEGCRQAIAQIGCWGPGSDLFATPNGSYSNRVQAVAAKLGVKWMRNVFGPTLVSRGLIGPANPLNSGAQSLAGQTDAVRALALLDLMILYGASTHFYTHGIITGASDALNTNVTVFDAFCAGVKARIDAGTLICVKPSVFIAETGPVNMDAVLATPNRLTLVANTSPFDLINTAFKPLRFFISGGAVSAITYSRDGTNFDATGAVSGQFDVSPGDRLRITYTAAPTIVQCSV